MAFAVPPVLGQAIGIASTLLPNWRTFYLKNLDDGEQLQGQFEATDVTENITANWAEHTALNRQNPIVQFLNGGNDRATLNVRLYQDSVFGDPILGGGQLSLDQGPLQKLKKIKSFARINDKVRRPPILDFTIGDGHVGMTAVITAISDIKYDRPNFFGGFSGVQLSLGLMQFVPFSIDDQRESDTRYAIVKERDTYEMLALREYGNAKLGDWVRGLHPTQPSLQPGMIVKLPSIDTARKQRVTQTSIPLKGAYSRKPTRQRALRQEFFDLRRRKRTSHILQPATTR
jgi:hypothetical protein